MSKIVTLKTSKPHRHGKSVNINGIKVEFDKLGFADVVERHVEELLKGGLEIVDEADIAKFSKMRAQLEEDEKSNVVPTVDLHDENAKLKVENDGFKKKIEALEKKIGEMEKSIPESEETGNEVSEDKEETEEGASVDDMLKPELIELCKEVKFPEKEWSKLGVDKLRAYVKGKLED